jgi:serine/threonine-protein kinase
MFTDEARLAARIHHANVVPIVELGADHDGYYVVMDYIEGSNLGHLHWHATKGRGKRTMSRSVALRIVLDALSGLHAAHEVVGDDGEVVNLVHRDVSPQNILIGVDGLARLLDFGIARASSHREFETRGPALKGKLEYMAPEQIECKEVDRTTDLFAMGIVLWEVLTGRRLFPAANQVTTIQRVCFDPIPSASSLEADVSQELARVCAKALERPRARRYPTAAAFAQELEKAAREDAGIATQREVAACMREVLGPSMPNASHKVKELAQEDAAPKKVPDLGKGSKGNASTHQLPPSDPMIRLAAPVASVSVIADAHPTVSNEPIDTEPDGPAPSLNKTTPIDPFAEVTVRVQPAAQQGVTVHYDERMPPEIIEEAGLRARSSSSDKTMAMVDPQLLDRQFLERVAAVGASAPAQSPPARAPAPSHPSRHSSRLSAPTSRPPMVAPAPPPARWGVAIAILAIGILVGVIGGGLGLARLTQQRAGGASAPATPAVATAATTASMPAAEHIDLDEPVPQPPATGTGAPAPATSESADR